jgi:hypothetical protein
VEGAEVLGVVFVPASVEELSELLPPQLAKPITIIDAIKIFFIILFY